MGRTEVVYAEIDGRMSDMPEKKTNNKTKKSTVKKSNKKSSGKTAASSKSKTKSKTPEPKTSKKTSGVTSKKVFTRESKPVMVTEVVGKEPDEIELSKEAEEPQLVGKEIDAETNPVKSDEKTDAEDDVASDKTGNQEKQELPTRQVRTVRRKIYGSGGEPNPGEGTRKVLLVVLPLLMLVAALLAGGYLYQLSLSPATDRSTQDVAEERGDYLDEGVDVEPTVTPTLEPVDLEAHEIRVLNGSGVAGAAGRLRGELEGEGFVVVGVGNAATQDYAQTVIRVPEDVDERYLAALQEYLGETYEVEVEEVEDAEEVVVVIGSN